MDLAAKVMLWGISIATAVNFMMFLACLKLYTEIMKEKSRREE